MEEETEQAEGLEIVDLATDRCDGHALQIAAQRAFERKYLRDSHRERSTR